MISSDSNRRHHANQMYKSDASLNTSIYSDSNYNSLNYRFWNILNWKGTGTDENSVDNGDEFGSTQS
ncbi:unnamed protein product [Adineta steineri]|uniref:Uncharacterized protein n=1 Tax=Adineta steineri TaxID=433720 RepID=A0A813RC03_9BILA|nr:unnamed protein product [Adineta steineri]CAF0939976.1 unnamed protein product [Adineta steineri]CAF1547475.1 unnamed protein product [Adineta steineri]